MKRTLFVVILLACSALQAQAQTAVVTGQVRSSDGTPAAGIRVALASMNERGQITPEVLARITTTDDAGRYRIEEIAPGRYGLIAGAVSSPTYYPGTAVAAEARVLSVVSGTTTTGVDFTLAAPLVVSRTRAPSHIDTAADLFPNGPARGSFLDLPDDEAGLLAYLTMLVLRRGQSSPGQPPPPTLDFALTGVEGRVVSFVGMKGGTVRSNCTECSFLMGESGISDPSSTFNAGIIFKLSDDWKSLSATCRATECLMASPIDGTYSRLPAEIPAVGPIYFRVTK